MFGFSPSVCRLYPLLIQRVRSLGTIAQSGRGGGGLEKPGTQSLIGEGKDGASGLGSQDHDGGSRCGGLPSWSDGVLDNMFE